MTVMWLLMTTELDLLAQTIIIILLLIVVIIAQISGHFILHELGEAFVEVAILGGCRGRFELE